MPKGISTVGDNQVRLKMSQHNIMTHFPVEHGSATPTMTIPIFSGCPLGSYHPELGNIVTRIPFGIALMCTGAAAPFVVGWGIWQGKIPWWILPIAILWCICVGLFGLYILVSWWNRIGRKIKLFEDGIVRSGFGDTVEATPWSKVSRILVTIYWEELPLKHGLGQVLPKTQRHTYEFTLHDETKWLIEEEDLQHKSTFPDVLYDIAVRKSIAWEECDVGRE